MLRHHIIGVPIWISRTMSMKKYLEWLELEVESTGKGVWLTKLLEDSLAFSKTLIDFGKFHDNTIKRFQWSSMLRSLLHGIHHLRLQLWTMGTLSVGVLPSKYSPHASSSDNDPPKKFSESSPQSAAHGDGAAETWKRIAIELSIIPQAWPLFQAAQY